MKRSLRFFEIRFEISHDALLERIEQAFEECLCGEIIQHDEVRIGIQVSLDLAAAIREIDAIRQKIVPREIAGLSTFCKFSWIQDSFFSEQRIDIFDGETFRN